MLVLPFLLAIWFGPVALCTTACTLRKRRVSIGDAMIVVAFAAVESALIARAPHPLNILGVFGLYLGPFVLFALYLPRPVDLLAAITWAMIVLIGMAVLLAMVGAMD